jgi:hypothetical protein
MAPSMSCRPRDAEQRRVARPSAAAAAGALRAATAGALRAATAVVAIVLAVAVPPVSADSNASTAVLPGPGTSDCTSNVPVLVVGGTPAGVAAAVTAARLGMPVVETEARPYLGGELTGAMLNMFDMDFGREGQDLARGVFLEIYRRLGPTFDVEKAKKVFLDEVRREPLITLHLRMRPVAVVTKGLWVKGVVFEHTRSHRSETICARRIVDATDDADIAAMAGVPYTLGRAGSGLGREMMSATLVFELGGVNWRQVVSAMYGMTTKGILRGGVYRGNVWGYGPIMRMYHPAQPGVGIYDLNLGLQHNGSVLVNGLLIFGVDGTDPTSVADGMRRGQAELPSLLAFLRDMAPGFSHAYLIRTADYLYIRETRHIRGLYTLTAQDIVDGRVFWDAIGVASYPIDIHPYRLGEHNPYAPRRYVYTIPFRSLVPVGAANLICASRSISATWEAAASARIVPTTMEEGQAAGAAAVLSLEAKVSVLQFAERPALVRALQDAIHAQGAYLLPATLASIGHAARLRHESPHASAPPSAHARAPH